MAKDYETVKRTRLVLVDDELTEFGPSETTKTLAESNNKERQSRDKKSKQQGLIMDEPRHMSMNDHQTRLYRATKAPTASTETNGALKKPNLLISAPTTVDAGCGGCAFDSKFGSDGRRASPNHPTHSKTRACKRVGENPSAEMIKALAAKQQSMSQNSCPSSIAYSTTRNTSRGSTRTTHVHQSASTSSSSSHYPSRRKMTNSKVTPKLPRNYSRYEITRMISARIQQAYAHSEPSDSPTPICTPTSTKSYNPKKPNYTPSAESHSSGNVNGEGGNAVFQVESNAELPKSCEQTKATLQTSVKLHVQQKTTPLASSAALSLAKLLQSSLASPSPSSLKAPSHSQTFSSAQTPSDLQTSSTLQTASPSQTLPSEAFSVPQKPPPLQTPSSPEKTPLALQASAPPAPSPLQNPLPLQTSPTPQGTSPPQTPSSPQTHPSMQTPSPSPSPPVLHSRAPKGDENGIVYPEGVKYYRVKRVLTRKTTRVVLGPLVHPSKLRRWVVHDRNTSSREFEYNIKTGKWYEMILRSDGRKQCNRYHEESRAPGQVVMSDTSQHVRIKLSDVGCYHQSTNCKSQRWLKRFRGKWEVDVPGADSQGACWDGRKRTRHEEEGDFGTGSSSDEEQTVISEPDEYPRRSRRLVMQSQAVTPTPSSPVTAATAPSRRRKSKRLKKNEKNEVALHCAICRSNTIGIKGMKHVCPVCNKQYLEVFE